METKKSFYFFIIKTWYINKNCTFAPNLET